MHIRNGQIERFGSRLFDERVTVTIHLCLRLSTHSAKLTYDSRKRMLVRLSIVKEVIFMTLHLSFDTPEVVSPTRGLVSGYLIAGSLLQSSTCTAE